MSKSVKIILLSALMLMLCGGALAATLELPAALTVIRAESFAGDTAIETVIVPEGVTSIESKAFANSGLDLIQLPSTLKSIAPDAFEGVTNFKAVAAEGTWAYTYCIENNIPIQNWVQETPASHFKYMISNSDGEKYVYISGAKTKLKDVVIPEKIEGYPVWYVDDGYFRDNTLLENLYVSDNVRDVFEASISNIVSVNYPSSTQFNVTGSKTLESVVIRKGVKREGESHLWIYPNTFKNCTNLKRVILSDDIEIIGDYAFQNCTSLTEVTLPALLIEMKDGAFDGCENLEAINGVIPNDWIFENTFRNCSNLESLILLDNVGTIDTTAFEDCENLTLTVMPGSKTIKRCDELGLKYVVTEYGYARNYWESTLEFTGYAGNNSQLTIPSEAYGRPVTMIGRYAFNGNKTVTSVKISEGVTELDMYAFYNCPSVRKISIPDTVKIIGECAFETCTSLKEITIPDSVTTIDSYAFSACSSLSRVKLPAGLTKISFGTFFNCESLAHVDIPDTVTEIAYGAFTGCAAMTEATVPASVKVIGDSAFNANSIFIEKLAILNKTADITIGDRIMHGYNNPTVYCYKYSGADAWAQSQGFNIVYLDDNDFSSVGSISLPESMRIAAGKTDWVPLSIFPDLGDLDIMWISKNGDVATVSNGMITAKAPGTAEISVIIGDKTASMTLTVYLELTSFDLSATEITIEAGSTHQLSCTNIMPAGAEAVFTYESSNALAASVDANGLITAKALGDTVITVTSDSGVERSCLVHVVRPA